MEVTDVVQVESLENLEQESANILGQIVNILGYASKSNNRQVYTNGLGCIPENVTYGISFFIHTMGIRPTLHSHCETNLRKDTLVSNAAWNPALTPQSLAPFLQYTAPEPTSSVPAKISKNRSGTPSY